MVQRFRLGVSVILSLFLITSACTAASRQTILETGKPRVVATTTQVGDVVRNIAGENLEVTVLLPAGVDPHSFQPTPQDAATIARADLIVANGAGLEEFLSSLLENAGSNVKLVYVSDGIQLLEAGETHGEESEEADGHDEGDPHTWFDPNNVILWTHNIEQALSEFDPSNAQAYSANAAGYRSQLEELDRWIMDQVAQIPPANRELVSDHTSFTYFAARYDFRQTGAIIASYSTLAEPSAQELAALEDTIRGLNVKAIFVGETVNPALASRITQDTGAQLVFLYTGSLSGPEGPAGTYLDYMRYNVNAIVEALK